MVFTAYDGIIKGGFLTFLLVLFIILAIASIICRDPDLLVFDES